MNRDKIKFAYLHKSYWGRAFQTSVRTAPQDGQSLHDFGCAQGVSRTKRGTVRRAADRPKDSLSGVVSSAHILGFQPGRDRTQLRL